jgi:hypothetical protein
MAMIEVNADDVLALIRSEAGHLSAVPRSCPTLRATLETRCSRIRELIEMLPPDQEPPAAS